MAHLLPLLGGVLLLFACGASTPPEKRPTAPKPGETVFNAQCALCHGRTGDLGLSGAKDLTTSALTPEEMTAIVTNGKGGMMAYGRLLTKEQIAEVVAYARTLRKTE